MAVSMEVSSRGNILVITASGAASNLEEHLEYASNLRRVHMKSGFKYLLLNETALQYNLNTTEVFKLGESIVSWLDVAVQVAVVVREKGTERFSFFEDVVTNRGLKLKYFTSETEAEAWLQPQS